MKMRKAHTGCVLSLQVSTVVASPRVRGAENLALWFSRTLVRGLRARGAGIKLLHVNHMFSLAVVSPRCASTAAQNG
jgi:hypothetical protein